MTATIDNKVVQMAFENSQFEKNVGHSMSTLEKLKKSLNFSDASKGFASITDAAGKVHMNPLTEAIQAVGGRFGALAVIGITALTRLTNAAINAGTAIARALVTDPVKMGYSEFELKMDSIQTIMAGTGESLETVNQKLNELNEYSDKTIYSFSDMTSNIGKFTNAGVSLEASVAAIQGIANAAALSGANANEASRAMYNFGQAISSGSVKLMDWKSIELANMATKEFKEQIMATAVEMGTIKELGDGMFQAVTGGDAFNATKMFNQSLEQQWFTADVLTKVLGNYADTTTDVGKRATAAAQDVKTLSMLYDTLKEAAQSGWAQTWETIVGDFEEGKKLFTSLSNFFGGILGASADARNSLLGGWKELGGRTALLEALQNILNAIVGVINPIRDGFRDIFPAMTAKRLVEITQGLAKFTKSLVLSSETADTVRRIFRGVFAIFDIAKMAVSAVAKEFGRLLTFLAPVPGGLAGILSKIGDFIVKVRDAIKANDIFGKVMRVIGDAILAVASVIGFAINAITKAAQKFSELNVSEGFLKSFSGAMTEFFNFFKTLDFSIIDGFLERLSARFGKTGDDVAGGMPDFITKILEATKPFREKLLTIAGNIREAIGKFVLSILDKIANIDFSNIDFSGAFDGINSGLLAALLLSITQFVRKGSGLFGSIVDIFKGMGDFAAGAGGILTSITTILTGVKDILTAYQQQIRAGILLKIAGAVALLAGSLIALSLVDSEKLTGALATITGLFANLFGAMAIYEKTSSPTGIPGMAKGIAGMIGLSVAVLILSGALVMLAQVPGDQIIKGALAITTLTGVLVAMSTALARNSVTMLQGSGSLIIFAIALRAMIGPIKKLGEMDTGAIVQGLIGLGVMLAEIAIFIKGMNFSAGDLEDIFGLLVLSGAISVLSSVIDQLGRLDASTLTQGLTVMGVLLAGLAGFTKIASGGGMFILTAAGMLVLAGAMTIMADVLAKIGSMSWEELSVALVGLGGSLLIMAVALNAMSGAALGAAALLVAAGALVILAPAMKILGSMSWEQVGIGLVAMAGAFTVLGLAASILTPLLPSLLLLGVAIGLIGLATLAAGAGVLAFATGLGALAVLGAGAGAGITAVLLAAAAAIPVLATALAIGIINFARVIKEGGPVIYEAAAAMMIGFVKSLTETIPAVIEMIMTFVTTLLTTVGENMPTIVQAGYDILLGFLEGVRANLPDVITVSYDIITAYLNGIAERLPEIVDSGWNLVISWIDAMTLAVDEHLPTLMVAVQKLGIAIVKGVIEGVNEQRNNAVQAIKDIGGLIVQSFKDFFGINSPSTVFIQLAAYLIQGFVEGLKRNIYTVVNKMVELGQDIVESMENIVDDMIKLGGDLVLGFAQGIGDFVDTAVQKAKELAQAVVNKVAEIIDSHSPSRVMIGLGKTVPEGFAIGIDKFSGKVMDATTGLADKTVSGFSSVVSRINDAINRDLEFSPTITPVLDMSSIRGGQSEFDRILNSDRLNVGVALSKANQIGARSAYSGVDASAARPDAIAGAATISYVQNNYSPKELSRVDIYRQTKVQLLQMKGLVGIQ